MKGFLKFLGVWAIFWLITIGILFGYDGSLPISDKVTIAENLGRILISYVSWPFTLGMVTGQVINILVSGG